MIQALTASSAEQKEGKLAAPGALTLGSCEGQALSLANQSARPHSWLETVVSRSHFAP